MEKLVVATGLHTHTLIYQGGGGVEEEMISQSSVGADRLLELKPELVTFVGNHEWCRAMAYWLREHGNGIDVRYVPKPAVKGTRQTMLAFGRMIFEGGTVGRSFFDEKRPERSEPEHPWYKTTQEYLEATNRVREEKHHSMSYIAVLFPEALRPSLSERKKGHPIPEPLPPDLWTKGMRVVVENPNPHLLQNDEQVPIAVRELARQSLGLALPEEIRRRYNDLHREHLTMLRLAEGNKAKAFKRLQELVDHPMRQIWPDSSSIVVLIGLVGWKKWKHFNELRHFAGLAVTRVDAKGGQRISRQRGEIRQYLYLLLVNTDLGKNLAEYEARHAKRELARVLTKFSDGAPAELAERARSFVSGLEQGEALDQGLYQLGRDLIALAKKDKETEFGRKSAFVGRRIMKFNSRVKRLERLLRGLWWFYLRENPLELPREALGL